MSVESVPRDGHPGTGLEGLDPSFELRLIDGIRPISEHFLAAALHHLFDTGLYDELAAHPDGMPLDGLADTLGLDRYRLEGFLRYLANEGVVAVSDGSATLTGKGRGYGEFRPWYTMLIGGYSTTVAQIGHALRRGAPSCTRDGRYVGLGSCQISRYDGIPITRDLLGRNGLDCRQVLDLGCGNGLYLVEFCQAVPGVTAWGAEPDAGGYAEAQLLVKQAGLTDRIRLVHTSATGFLADPPADCTPDLIVFGYVLQEILAQDGEERVVRLLRDVVDRFPGIDIVVVEVAAGIADPGVMRHGLARNFWNPYFLIHYFTDQRLETRRYWDELFARAGLRIVDVVSTDPRVDSTGLELGYLLRGRTDGDSELGG
jgi:2-ketoarginine methyltransferase